MRVLLRLVVVGGLFLALVEALGRGWLAIPNLLGYVLLACVPGAFLWASWSALTGKSLLVRVAGRAGITALAVAVWALAAFTVAASRVPFS